MTFDAFESAQETSQPIEIITIQIGAEAFYWTSSEDTQTISSQNYEAIPIQRGRIVQSPEDRATVVDFVVDGDNEFATRYVGIVPGNRAKITVQRVQRPDFPGPEVVTLYEGYIQSVKFSKDGYSAIIASLPIAAATARSIPRYTYQSLCNHVLFDDNCKVDNTDSTWRLGNAEVLTVSGSTITVQGADSEADGWYTGGFVEAQGGQDSRLILEHTGTSLLLLLPFPFDLVGQDVTVFAGCDHTIGVCDSKFNTPEDVDSNAINYGGFAFVPTRDIFRVGIQ